MAVDDHGRHVLHTRLEQVLGPEEASELMSYLPPVGWADVATKRDLDHFADRLRTELHREIGGLRGEIGGLRGEIGGLRGEMYQQIAGVQEQIGGLQEQIGGLRGEMHQQIGALRTEFVTELHDQVGALRSEVRTDIRRLDEKIDHNLRVFVFSTVGAVLTTAGLAFGAASIV